MKEEGRRKVLDEGFVILYECSDSILSLDKALEMVGSVASLSRRRLLSGEEARRLGRRLLKWGHLSPFEFVRIPCSNFSHDPQPLGIDRSWRNQFSLYLRIWKEVSPGELEKRRELHRNNLVLFLVRAPIFVARQIMRHRSFSFMERSLRYGKADLSFYCPDEELKRWLKRVLEEAMKKAGCLPREVRNRLLPLAGYTDFFMMGDVFAFANFFLQRRSAEAQKETRLYAEAMWELLKERRPVLYGFIERTITKLRREVDYVQSLV